MNPGSVERLLFISLHITFPCNTEIPLKRGLQAYPLARITHIVIFENTHQDLRANRNNKMFFRQARISRAMVNLIIDSVQSHEIHQIRYRPSQSWRTGNSAFPAHTINTESKRLCAFLKTHRNPCFKIFRPMNPSTWPPLLR